MRTSVALLSRSKTSVFLALAPAVLLAGCENMKIKMGKRISIAPLPVTAMDVRLADSQGIAPGKKARLIVTFTAPGGKVWQTEGAGGGPIMWQDLNVASTLVSANSSGEVSLPRDPRLSDGKTGHVVVTVPTHSDLRAEIDVPLRYDQKYYADFSGSKGIDGINGTNGSDGLRGSDGNPDPQHGTAGGNGSDGSDGQSGGNGSSGGSGIDVHIWLAQHPRNPALIEAEVESGRNSGRHTDTFFLIDPNGGSLTVKTDGGRGGDGGKGGRGGRGGDGGSGWPTGSRGRDGLDGHNGLSGSDGRGGQIIVTYDPNAAPYLKILQLSNWNGPRPVFESRRLNPLW